MRQHFGALARRLHVLNTLRELLLHRGDARAQRLQRLLRRCGLAIDTLGLIGRALGRLLRRRLLHGLGRRASLLVGERVDRVLVLGAQHAQHAGAVLALKVGEDVEDIDAAQADQVGLAHRRHEEGVAWHLAGERVNMPEDRARLLNHAEHELAAAGAVRRGDLHGASHEEVDLLAELLARDEHLLLQANLGLQPQQKRLGALERAAREERRAQQRVFVDRSDDVATELAGELREDRGVIEARGDAPLRVDVRHQLALQHRRHLA
mmetsp:Transcript_5676/g.15075  ORF Transcript_5676/g.15075 Transcript_5676/m.15075 type:complete len:265 (+) Transcript_5676:224-1018(+)